MRKSLLIIATCAIALSCDNAPIATTDNNASALTSTSKTAKTTCGFDAYLEDTAAKDPELEARLSAQEAFISNYTAKLEAQEKSGKQNLPLLTIPVVINHLSQSGQRISQAVVDAQMVRLNEVFSGVYASRASSRPSGLPSNARQFGAGNTRIRFTLQAINHRNGSEVIDFFTSNLQFPAVALEEFGGITPTSLGSVINIYVISNLTDATGIRGSGSIPGQATGDQAIFDNIYIDELFFGGDLAPEAVSEGLTLAHEVGHHLNLFHLPGRATENCRFDDAVRDTPNTSKRYSGTVRTGASTTSCGSQDMYWNIMSSVDDSHRFLFTNGQRNRMRATLAGVRSGLVQ